MAETHLHGVQKDYAYNYLLNGLEHLGNAQCQYLHRACTWVLSDLDVKDYLALPFRQGSQILSGSSDSEVNLSLQMYITSPQSTLST